MWSALSPILNGEPTGFADGFHVECTSQRYTSQFVQVKF